VRGEEAAARRRRTTVHVRQHATQRHVQRVRQYVRIGRGRLLRGRPLRGGVCMRGGGDGDGDGDCGASRFSCFGAAPPLSPPECTLDVAATVQTGAGCTYWRGRRRRL
jgi:hypothetical protein